MLGVALYEGFDEGGFADAWRAHDRHNDGWGFFREAVDERDMETLLFDLCRPLVLRRMREV